MDHHRWTVRAEEVPTGSRYRIQPEGDTVHCRLPGRLVASQVERLRRTAAHCLTRPARRVVMLGDGVEEVDSSAVAALVQIAQACVRHGRRLHISRPSPILSNVVSHMRLERMLGLIPGDAPARSGRLPRIVGP